MTMIDVSKLSDADRATLLAQLGATVRKQRTCSTCSLVGASVTSKTKFTEAFPKNHTKEQHAAHVANKGQGKSSNTNIIEEWLMGVWDLKAADFINAKGKKVGMMIKHLNTVAFKLATEWKAKEGKGFKGKHAAK
jgi:hypothetical protein